MFVLFKEFDLFCFARVLLYSVSPRQSSSSIKLPYVPSENILLQELCYLIHCQEPTLPGIVAAGPEGPCLTHFISLENNFCLARERAGCDLP